MTDFFNKKLQLGPDRVRIHDEGTDSVRVSHHLLPLDTEIMSSPTADPIVIPIVHVAPASPAPVVVTAAAPASRVLLLAWVAVVMCRLVLAGMGPAFKFMQSFHIAAARAAFWYACICFINGHVISFVPAFRVHDAALLLTHSQIKPGVTSA